MIIDIHNHISVKHSPYYLSSQELVAAMDEAGVDRAVILGKDYGSLGDVRNENLTDEEVAEYVLDFPDRLIGFTAAHPERGKKAAVDRVVHAIQTLGLRGIKLNPAAGFFPNDRALYPVYEKALELGVPVIFHSGIKPPAQGCRLKYCSPVYLDDVVVDFPELRVIIAHAGYPWVEETIMVGLYAENVFADISTLNQVETVLGYPVMVPALHRLFLSLGSGRIVFGSDGVFNMSEIAEAVKGADFLSDADKENILWKNAAAILGLNQGSDQPRQE